MATSFEEAKYVRACSKSKLSRAVKHLKAMTRDPDHPDQVDPEELLEIFNLKSLFKTITQYTSVEKLISEDGLRAGIMKTGDFRDMATHLTMVENLIQASFLDDQCTV